MREQGVEPVLIPNDTGDKIGLIATLGPNNPGGVILSGHCDVVPVDGQVWQSDPFKMAQRDGNLFGRGAADMKGFLAVCLSIVAEMRRANPPAQGVPIFRVAL